MNIFLRNKVKALPDRRDLLWSAAPFHHRTCIVPASQLKNIESHFAFGKNWASYAALIDQAQIDEAQKALLKLIPAADFAGRSFLDIGCGSGLHALAAARLGVSRIMAVDLDPDSVATTRAVLSNNGVTIPWRAEAISVFDLDSARLGTFDIVYSWGVLHHTGSMWEAVSKAASMVAPNGLLAIALYRRTHMDAFWKIEKRLYAHAPRAIQRVLSAIYVAALRLTHYPSPARFREFIANYKTDRGMDFYHNVHDWLGGYPYETADAAEVDAKLANLGFKAERVFAQPQHLGVFGSGCDEYVYRAIRTNPRPMRDSKCSST
jgi:2-polyprenyl-6-hydroxyphenyl methylase/3-demethylubiquinone-9 3-methyltransferase